MPGPTEICAHFARSGTLRARKGARTGDSPAAAAELFCAGALLWRARARSNCKRTNKPYLGFLSVDTSSRSAFARGYVGAAWPGQVCALLEAADSPHARISGIASVVRLSNKIADNSQRIVPIG